MRCRLLSLVLLCSLTAFAPAADGPVYELRVYTCNAGKLEALNSRFREHTLKLFEKHGMKNIAYWTPTEGPAAETTLYYILEHASRDAAKASWAAFLADPEWKKVAADSKTAHGEILAGRPASTYMARTDYSPSPAPVDPSKLYELRTYVAAEGKLDPLNARFRNHTDRLFRKHGITPVCYFTPLDEPASKTTLIYVLQHASADAVKPARAAFGADPEWKTAKAESEKDGPLLAGTPESLFLKTVDYSPKP